MVLGAKGVVDTRLHQETQSMCDSLPYDLPLLLSFVALSHGADM